MNKITKIIITVLIFTIVSTLTVYLLMVVFNKLTTHKDKEDINVVNKAIIKDTTSSEKKSKIELLKKEIDSLKKRSKVEKVENKKALNKEIIEYTTQVQFYILNNKEKSIKVLNSKLIKLKRYFAIKGLDDNTNRLLRISIKSIENEIKLIKKTNSNINTAKTKRINKVKKEKRVKKDTIIVKKDSIVNKKNDTIN